jgi:hypothetical protein
MIASPTSSQQATAPLTLGQVARHFGRPTWMVRRLFERGILPPPPRVGQNRIVHAEDLPVIAEAMRQVGYLPPAEPEQEREVAHAG